MDFKSDFGERLNTLTLDGSQIKELEQACDYFKGVLIRAPKMRQG